MRKIELCFERVCIARVAGASRAGECTHRPVAQNGADAMGGVVADQDAPFIVSTYSNRPREAGSERVVAVHARAPCSTPSECADAAVVVDDPQALL